MKTTRKSTLWRLLSFLKPKRFQYFSSMMVVGVIYATERVFTGFIVKWFTDSIVEQNMENLIRTTLYWGLFALGQILFTPLFLYLWRASVTLGTANLRQAAFSHLQRLPLGYYEGRHSGEAMSILSNDVTAAEQAYQDNIFALAQNTFMGVGAIIFMLIMKWDLALLIILAGLFPLIINTISAKPLRIVGDETQSKLAGLSERLADLLAGFMVVRTFSLGDWILRRFSKSNREVLDANLKRVRIESALAAGNDFGGIFLFLPYLISAYMVLNGELTLGVMMGLIQLNNPVQNFVYSLGGTISRLQGSLAAADRILNIMDTPIEPERYQSAAGQLTASAVTPSQAAQQQESIIEFQGVKFSYSDNLPILQDITFDIQPGQLAAFVGPSGSGKSTIFRLLLGYYPALSGRITIYGKPIADYSLSELRELSAFVPQDAYLYAGSVRENIRYGRPAATEDEIIAAAQASYAHEFITELQDGYDTLVGERGARLSGGQRQRIAIARALIKNAPILLLDEATSALDSESEEVVQQALNSLMKDRTTIAIAHRLSTIERADVIYVVESGRVVEQGRHTELIGKGGLYSYLYELQFKDAPQAAPAD